MGIGNKKTRGKGNGNNNKMWVAKNRKEVDRDSIGPFIIKHFIVHFIPPFLPISQLRSMLEYLLDAKSISQDEIDEFCFLFCSLARLIG